MGEQECVMQKVSINDVPESGDDEERRESLVDKIFQDERMEMWEARGYRARCIGEFQKVLPLVKRYEQFRSMSDEELEKAYTEEGLLTEQTKEREDLLKALKAVMIWERLPLTELQREAEQHQPPICARTTAANDEERRRDLIQQLIVDILRSSYELQGIPVKRIGLREAYYVGNQLFSFESMEDLELKVA